MLGLYRPPVFKGRRVVEPRPRRSFRCRSTPPLTGRSPGALVVLVAVQLSVTGLYFPPVFHSCVSALAAPDDHFAVSPHCRGRDSGSKGALFVLVGVQLSAPGLYLPPVLIKGGSPAAAPPQTIISLSAHTAV